MKKSNVFNSLKLRKMQNGKYLLEYNIALKYRISIAYFLTKSRWYFMTSIANEILLAITESITQYYWF